MEFDPEKIPARAVYNLLIGLVAPRPIALVTSMDEEGLDRFVARAESLA